MGDGDYNYQSAKSVTVTTTGNIDNLDIDGVGMLIMNNASLATLRGIDAGYHGQLLVIFSIGAGNVGLAHQNTNSSAANRLLNQVTGTDTVLSAGTGTALYQYDGAVALRWRLIKFEQGAAIDIAFNAGNYTGSGTITWTVASGDQTTLNYVVNGKFVTLVVRIEGTTVAGTGTELRIALPAAITPASSVAGTALVFDNGVGAGGFFSLTAASTTLSFFRTDLANWAAATDATSVYAIITYPIT